MWSCLLENRIFIAKHSYSRLDEPDYINAYGSKANYLTLTEKGQKDMDYMAYLHVFVSINELVRYAIFLVLLW